MSILEHLSRRLLGNWHKSISQRCQYCHFKADQFHPWLHFVRRPPVSPSSIPLPPIENFQITFILQYKDLSQFFVVLVMVQQGILGKKDMWWYDTIIPSCRFLSFEKIVFVLLAGLAVGKRWRHRLSRAQFYILLIYPLSDWDDGGWMGFPKFGGCAALGSFKLWQEPGTHFFDIEM